MPGSLASRPVALITGASSGIGECLAHCFAEAGHDLVLVARSADKLRLLAGQLMAEHGIKAWAEPADLALAGSVAELATRLKRQRRPVSVLVNCAGVLSQGAFIDMPTSTTQGMLELNVGALTAMLSTFVPAMVARGSGRVLNVASIAAFQPIPSLATYAASKAYVLSLSESLAEELRGSGVTVTALCPGITATNMLAQAAQADPALSHLPALLVGDAMDVARQGFQACMRGDAICVPGIVNQAVTLGSRAVPKWLVRRLGGWAGRAMARKEKR